jgi:hypothetical protein
VVFENEEIMRLRINFKKFQSGRAVYPRLRSKLLQAGMELDLERGKTALPN